MAKCKQCGKQFTQFNSLNKVCGFKCAIELGKLKPVKVDIPKSIVKDLKKIHRESRSYLLKEAVFWFNKYIRNRDKDKGCISCGKPLQIHNTDAGHLWSAGGHAYLKFDEFNVNGQCSRPCNKDLSGNINNYRINFVKRYSQQLLDELDSKAHIQKKWTEDELKEIILKYKKYYKSN